MWAPKRTGKFAARKPKFGGGPPAMDDRGVMAGPAPSAPMIEPTRPPVGMKGGGGVSGEAMAKVGRNMARAQNQGMKEGGMVRGVGAARPQTFSKNG